MIVSNVCVVNLLAAYFLLMQRQRKYSASECDSDARPKKVPTKDGEARKEEKLKLISGQEVDSMTIAVDIQNQVENVIIL